MSLYAAISVTRNAFHARTKVKVGGQHAVNWSKRVLERSLHRVRSYPASVCCATGPVTVVRSVSPACDVFQKFLWKNAREISHFAIDDTSRMGLPRSTSHVAPDPSFAGRLKAKGLLFFSGLFLSSENVSYVSCTYIG